MKKHLLSIALGLLVGTSAFAQVEFIDDVTGEVIPNGSTVVKNIIDTCLFKFFIFLHWFNYYFR